MAVYRPLELPTSAYAQSAIWWTNKTFCLSARAWFFISSRFTSEPASVARPPRWRGVARARSTPLAALIVIVFDGVCLFPLFFWKTNSKTKTCDCAKKTTTKKQTHQSLVTELRQKFSELGDKTRWICVFYCTSLFDRKQTNLALSDVVYLTKDCELEHWGNSIDSLFNQDMSDSANAIAVWTVCLFFFFVYLHSVVIGVHAVRTHTHTHTSMKEGLDPTSATDEFHTWRKMQHYRKD